MSLSNRHFLIISFLFWALTLGAQTIRLVDSDGQNPIIGAYIVGSLPNDVLETGQNGLADISSLSRYDSLTISHIGYMDRTLVNHFDPSNTTVVELQQGILFNEEILIIDRAPQQKRSDLPAYIETLKADELRSAHPQTAADYVSQANGVFLQKSQLGGGSLLIRGFAANRILLVVDGVRMNNAIFRSGNLQNIISVDPNALDRVNILLGPNSLKYGSDALGGVISMQTKKPILEDGFSGHISAQHHSANQEKTLSVGLNYGRNKWAWRGNVSYSDFDDLVMGSHGPDSYLRTAHQVSSSNDGTIDDFIIFNGNPKKQVNTGYSQVFTQQQLSYELNEENKLSYSFYYSRSSDVPRYDRLIQTSNNGFSNVEWYYGPQKWMMHKLNYTVSSNKKLYNYLNINAAYQNYQESRHDRRFGDPLLRNRVEKLNIYNLNVDASKIINQYKISYGSEWTYNRVRSAAHDEDINTGAISSIQTRYPDKSSMQSLAIYLQGVVTLSPRVSLSGGIRYTRTSLSAPISNEFIILPFSNIDLTTSNLSSSLGLSYVPTENVFFYANLSTGFRTPNIDDVGKVFDSEPGNIVVPNDQLQPEKVYSGELGIESRYASGFNYHFGIYYMHLNDIISRQDFLFNGQDSILYDGVQSKVQSLQNADSGYIYGIEGKIKYRFSSNWNIHLQASYQKGEEKINGINNPLRHVAPLFGNMGVKYEKEKYSLISSLKYNRQISFDRLADTERAKPHIYAADQNGDPYSPSWWTWEIKGEYHLGKIDINLGIENILDKRYRPYSSGIVSAGRSAVVAIRYTL